MARRIRRIFKGYVKSARERLDELEAELNARRELDEYLEPGGSPGTPPPVSTSTRAETTTSSAGTQPTTEGRSVPSEALTLSPDLLAHYRLLGIPPNADIRQAQEAYKQLMERANPERFPEGSEERRRAEQIRQRIQQAYDAIRQHLDPTSARFDRLEI